MKKAEQLVCGPVAQLFSFVGIDVTYHQRHIILSKVVKGRAFWKDPTDEFMCDFDAALLIGTLRITVEYSGSALSVFTEFDGKRICEFTAAITVILNSG